MKRVTANLEDAAWASLRKRSRVEGPSVSDLIRRAIDTYLIRVDGLGSLPPFVGIGRSGRSDIAETQEEVLIAGASIRRRFR